MAHQPAFVDRSLDAGAKLLARAAGHVRDCDLTGHVADMSKSTLMTHYRHIAALRNVDILLGQRGENLVTRITAQ